MTFLSLFMAGVNEALSNSGAALHRLCFPPHGRFGVHSAANLSLLAYLSPGAVMAAARQDGIKNMAGVVFQTG